MDTSLPRISVGAISAMYMGETFEASPIPIPPTMRATINGVKLCESAVKMAERMRSMVENLTVEVGGRNLKVTASFGVMRSPGPGAAASVPSPGSSAGGSLHRCNRVPAAV